MFKASNGETSFGKPNDIARYSEPIPHRTLVVRWTFNGTLGIWNIAQLDKPIERISKIWLTGYCGTGTASKVNPLKILFDTRQSSKFSSGLNLVGNSGVDNCIFLVNETEQTGFANAAEKMLIGEWKMSDASIDILAIRVFDAFTDLEVPFTKLLLIFEVEALTWF